MSFIRAIFLVLTYFLSFQSFSQKKTATVKALENHLQNDDVEKTLLENKGQWPKGVLFQLKTNGGKLWIQQRKMIFHLQDYSALHHAHSGKETASYHKDIRETLVHINFLGSNETHEIQKINPTKHYYNYFKGNDSTKWASNVHGYEYIQLNDIYKGINLKVLGHSEQVKYEFHVNPEIDPSVIKLNYSGQKSISIDTKGNLVIETELGKIIEQKPYAYQLINGKETKVRCQFNLDGNNLSFRIGRYNPKYILVIDPVLIFATFVGAKSDNFGMTATYGHDGSAYSGGIIYGNDYPTPDSLAYDINSNFTVSNPAAGISDVFLSKYSADGKQMIWGTFIGGGNNSTGTETVHSMICDKQDNLYFFGATSSKDFPTTNEAFDKSFNGGNNSYKTNFLYNGVHFENLGTDIFVAKISANGHNLLGSTFIGGTENDGVSYDVNSLPYDDSNLYNGLTSNYGDQFRGEIMLDDQNNVLVASCTRSSNFPTVSPIQENYAGNQDGVLFKLKSSFDSLIFSTYYGGNQRDACNSVKIDNSGNIIVVGGTQSNNLKGISNTGTWQTTFGGGTVDGFIVKLVPNGDAISSATYVGKSGYDQLFFVEIDRLDNIFVLGQSQGSGASNGNGYIPIVNALYHNGTSNNFIIKFNPTLTTILNSTRFGKFNESKIHLSPTAFMVDICGNIYVSGWGANILQSVKLSGMPITKDAFQSTTDGFDFYLFVLKANFNDILYGSYLGGKIADEHVDGGTSRFDKNGIVYQSVCGGCGGVSDFPTTSGAWSASNNSSNCNNVIFKFSTGIIPIADFKVDQTEGCKGLTVTFDNFSTKNDYYLWDFGNGNIDDSTFEPKITYNEAGKYTVYLYVTDSICLLTDTAKIEINIYDSIKLNLPTSLLECNNKPLKLTPNSFGTARNFIWSKNRNMLNPIQNSGDSSIWIEPDQAAIYFLEANNGFCSKKDSVQVLFSPPAIAAIAADTSKGCLPLTVTLSNLSVNEDFIQWDFAIGNHGKIINDSTIEFNTKGNYTISLIARDGICKNPDTASVKIEVLDTIHLSVVDSIFICNSEPFLITAKSFGTSNSFIWSDNNEFTNVLNDNSSDPDIVVNKNGTYYISANNGYCTDTDSSVIQFNTPPKVSFTLGETKSCAPATVKIDNNSTQTDYFRWNFGNGVFDSVNFEPTFVLENVGNYIVQLIVSDTACDIVDTALAEISVYPTISISQNENYNLCKSIPIEFKPVFSGNPNKFIWSSYATFEDTLNQDLTLAGILVNDPQEGYYYLKASNDGCFQKDSVRVEIISSALSLNSSNSVCLGETTTVTATNSNPSITFSYNWSPNSIIINSTNTSSAIVKPTKSQYIYLTATSSNGCYIQDSIFINVSTIDSTLVSATASKYNVAAGTVVLLSGLPNGLSSYSWSPSLGLSTPNAQTTNAVVEENTIYTLTVSNGICSKSDTAEVKVFQLICNGEQLFVPNSFSPNGDNHNDKLYLRGHNIEKMIFRIFDRWGEMVFETTDQSIGWDGTFRGKKLDPDVYVYYADITCIGGLNEIVKGNVTLMK
jgi:gliding motility-associated-like protein